MRLISVYAVAAFMDFANSQIRKKKKKKTTEHRKEHFSVRTLYNAEVCDVIGNSIQLHPVLSLTLHTLISLKEISPPLNLFPRRAAHKVIVWHSLYLFCVTSSFHPVFQLLKHHSLSMLLQQNSLIDFPKVVPELRVILSRIFEQCSRI